MPATDPGDLVRTPIEEIAINDLIYNGIGFGLLCVKEIRLPEGPSNTYTLRVVGIDASDESQHITISVLQGHMVDRCRSGQVSHLKQ